MSRLSQREAGPTLARGLLVVAGLFQLFVGLALLFAPAWFFEHVGPFPPFNRHYMGDAGAFLTPWGLGLLVAARAPGRHRALVGLAALANLLHVANHLYDDVAGGHWHMAHFLGETLPLLVLTGALGALWQWLRAQDT